MESLDPLLNSLRGIRASGIRLPGYIDRDEAHPRFVPLANTAYLVLDDGYLRLDSIGNHGQLALRLVPDVEVPSVLADEDEEFSLASYEHLFFADAYQALRLTGIRYVLNRESDPANGTVRCAELEFENAWPLFADPSWHFGIRLEGIGAYKRWVETGWDSPALPFQEYSWRP